MCLTYTKPSPVPNHPGATKGCGSFPSVTPDGGMPRWARFSLSGDRHGSGPFPFPHPRPRAPFQFSSRSSNAFSTSTRPGPKYDQGRALRGAFYDASRAGEHASPAGHKPRFAGAEPRWGRTERSAT